MRLGLLVGVGSGAPSPTDDVRLGDVVVGIPTDENGSVIQFGPAPDAGGDDDKSGGCSGGGGGGGGSSGDGDGCYGRCQRPFVRTRCLNAPPHALLSALSVLKALHGLNGSSACDILAQAAQKFSKTQYVVPVAGDSGSGSGSGSGGGGGRGGGEGKEGWEEMDRLYQTDYVHVRGSSRNNICGRCDASMLVQRPRRDLDGPAVHYGMIASGDQEIECGIMRDLAKQALGALCFEREVAGLMDNFPCLVIRGICDYADTHKSVCWQSYAAATAAAFAKELLEYTPPQEIEEMATIVEVMKDGKSLSPLTCASTHFLADKRPFSS